MTTLTFSLGISTALAGMALTHTGVTLLGFCLCVIATVMTITSER